MGKKKKASGGAKILVCSKSKCKRKCEKVYAAIKSEIDQRGLEKRIRLKKTGCISECKNQPAVVVKPGNERYTEVTVKHVSRIVDKVQRIARKK